MADENPLTVYVAENAQLAEAVVRLLAGEGVAAEIVSPPPQTATEPITGMSELVTPDSLEVRVTDPDKVTKAKEVLGSALSIAALRAVHEKRSKRTGNVTAVCEDCGKSSDWPASAMGTTEVCPHCGGYMDIPDPDENWDGMDFGDPEDEVETNE